MTTVVISGRHDGGVWAECAIAISHYTVADDSIVSAGNRFFQFTFFHQYRMRQGVSHTAKLSIKKYVKPKVFVAQLCSNSKFLFGIRISYEDDIFSEYWKASAINNLSIRTAHIT